VIDPAILDVIALLWFAGCWGLYAFLADRGKHAGRSMTGVMSAYRLRWMREMVRRENRVVDTTILGNQLNGAAFFASTAILLIGGLFALLGATDQAIAVFEHLPLIAPPSRALWEIKILLLIAIFGYAFFKFAWAFRLFNTCSVLVGATPVEAVEDADMERTVLRIARVNSLAAEHFNSGMRAYFFSLATLGWFLHAGVFLAATAWVVLVLYRREFRSRSLRAVCE
jgi:uncharacterized membrane protein